MKMTKNEERRRNKVIDAISDIKFPNVILLNRVNDEYKALREMVIDKLALDLLEQECSSSGNKPFTWMLEDIKDCQEVEDYAYFLPQSYSNNGELHYNNNYDFFDEESEENDLNDYTTKISENN